MTETFNDSHWFPNTLIAYEFSLISRARNVNYAFQSLIISAHSGQLHNARLHYTLRGKVKFWFSEKNVLFTLFFWSQNFDKLLKFFSFLKNFKRASIPPSFFSRIGEIKTIQRSKFKERNTRKFFNNKILNKMKFYQEITTNKQNFGPTIWHVEGRNGRLWRWALKQGRDPPRVVFGEFNSSDGRRLVKRGKDNAHIDSGFVSLAQEDSVVAGLDIKVYSNNRHAQGRFSHVLWRFIPVHRLCFGGWRSSVGALLFWCVKVVHLGNSVHNEKVRNELLCGLRLGEIEKTFCVAERWLYGAIKIVRRHGLQYQQYECTIQNVQAPNSCGHG